MDSPAASSGSSSCPICQAASTFHVTRLQRKDLGTSPTYDIRRCKSCGHMWASGPTEQRLYDEIYSKYFYDTSQQSVPHAPDGSLLPEAENYPPLLNGRKRARWLHDLGFSGRLLDIGAGRGYFVYAANEYFAAEGFEIQHEAVKIARKMGITMHEGDIMAPQTNLPAYDVVTLWDVFSGFDAPHDMIDKLMRLVRPGGALVMTVPDCRSLVARMAGKRWPLMIPPGNLHFYTRESVLSLFDRPDVHSLHMSHQGKLVSVGFLWHKFLRSAGLYKLAMKKWPIPPSWRIPLNLGDIITIVVERSG